MSEAEASRFNVKAEDLRKYPWQERLAEHLPKECQTYYQVFGRGAAEYRDTGDEVGQRVYEFLNVISSFYPNFGSHMTPYRPMRQDYDGNRSLIPDDLTDQDLDALDGILPEIEDAEFRARVADVLWICRKKNFKAAKIAVVAFLEAASHHKTGVLWPPYIERINRAAVISARKGFEKERARVVATVEAAIREFQEDPGSGLLCSRLMGVLLLLDVGEPAVYIELAENLAKSFAGIGEWHFAQEYWAVAESWHRRNKDEAAMQRSLIEAAECLVSRAEAEASKQPPQNGAAAHWMGQALEALRRAKAEPARIKEVHRMLLSLQKQSLGDLRPFDFDPESIPDFVENRDAVQQAARAHVSGLDFERAVLRFAHIGEPTDLAQLIESERTNSEGIIWDKLMGSTRLDRDGKVADIMPAMGFPGDEPDQVAFRKKLVHTASMFGWPMAVEWRIEPARQAISLEHALRFRDLAFLVTNNPFIRPGHEGIYLKGIQAGFFGDWLMAMHLLIPQLEESLRFVLQQHRGITSTLKQGIQMERDINDLLWEKEAEEIFGEDILFDLRGILIERFGCNMRNEMAHGLMSEGAFYRAESVYLWWLVIRLCWIGFRAAQADDPQEAT